MLQARTGFRARARLWRFVRQRRPAREPALALGAGRVGISGAAGYRDQRGYPDDQ